MSIYIRVKKRIQESSTVVYKSSTSQATEEETVTGDDSTIEAATPFNNQEIGKETVAGDDAQPPIEYDEDYEFDSFFQGAGWFYVVVIAVQEEEYVCQVRFGGGNDPSFTIKVEELDRLCGEPELGEIGFQFVRKFR